MGLLLVVAFDTVGRRPLRRAERDTGLGRAEVRVDLVDDGPAPRLERQRAVGLVPCAGEDSLERGVVGVQVSHSVIEIVGVALQ
jgi:hypothetical protein